MLCRTGSRFPTDFLISDSVGLGSYCYLAAGLVGGVEPLNAGVKGPDRLFPWIFSKNAFWDGRYCLEALGKTKLALC